MSVIGGSHTGKSYTVRNLIIGGSLRPRGRGLVYILAPNKVSIEQPLWDAFGTLKIKHKRILLNKKLAKPDFVKGSTLIFDDVDDVNRVPKWLEELYTIEGHHSEISIVKISHKVKCGDVAARGCVHGVIMHDLPSVDFKNALRNLGISCDITKLFSDPLGLVKTKEGPFRNFNKVYIDNLSKMTNTGRRDAIYRIKDLI